MRKLEKYISCFIFLLTVGREPQQGFRWLQSQGRHALNIFAFEMMLFSESFPRLAVVVGGGREGGIRENVLKSFHPLGKVLV